MMSHVVWHDITKHSTMYLLHYDVTCCVAWHHKTLRCTCCIMMSHVVWHDITLRCTCCIMMSHVVWHDITKHSMMYLLHYDVTCCVAWHHEALYDVPAALWCHMCGMTSQSTLRCTCCLMMSQVVWHDITKHSTMHLLHFNVTCCVAWHHKALYDVPAALWCHMLCGMTSQSTLRCTCCIMMSHVVWHDITKHSTMYLLHYDVTCCVAWHHKALYDVPAALLCHMLCVGTLPRSLNKDSISNYQKYAKNH